MAQGTVEERFHDVKKYYEIVEVNGQKVMTYRASCRQPRCMFITQYKTEEARARGIREHRRTALIKRRLRNALIRFPNDGQKRKAVLLAQADNETHDLTQWLDAVDIIVRAKSGVDTHTLIDYDYEKAYRLGWSAHKAAKDSLHHQLEITR